jgi:hypothetical protein
MLNLDIKARKKPSNMTRISESKVKACSKSRPSIIKQNKTNQLENESTLPKSFENNKEKSI